MLNVDAEIREKYFFDALHFLQNRYGKENLMYSPTISFGENPINYSNYREHIPEIIAKMKKNEAEITEILKDPKMTNPNDLWVTSHSVVYDLEKKTMSVAVYERFDKYFDYSL